MGGVGMVGWEQGGAVRRWEPPTAVAEAIGGASCHGSVSDDGATEADPAVAVTRDKVVVRRGRGGRPERKEKPWTRRRRRRWRRKTTHDGPYWALKPSRRFFISIFCIL